VFVLPAEPTAVFPDGSPLRFAAVRTPVDAQGRYGIGRVLEARLGSPNNDGWHPVLAAIPVLRRAWRAGEFVRDAFGNTMLEIPAPVSTAALAQEQQGSLVRLLREFELSADGSRYTSAQRAVLWAHHRWLLCDERFHPRRLNRESPTSAASAVIAAWTLQEGTPSGSVPGLGRKPTPQPRLLPVEVEYASNMKAEGRRHHLATTLNWCAQQGKEALRRDALLHLGTAEASVWETSGTKARLRAQLGRWERAQKGPRGPYAPYPIVIEDRSAKVTTRRELVNWLRQPETRQLIEVVCCGHQAGLLGYVHPKQSTTPTVRTLTHWLNQLPIYELRQPDGRVTWRFFEPLRTSENGFYDYSGRLVEPKLAALLAGQQAGTMLVAEYGPDDDLLDFG
jgi:hypothetical protein